MKLGHWKPFNLFGYALLAFGSGLLTRIYPPISPGYWIGMEILVGAGYSLSVTMPQLGVQATLAPDIVHIGSTTLLFVMSISCAISLAIGQAIFQAELSHNLAEFTSGDTIRAVQAAGVSGVKSVVPPQVLARVVQGYSDALTTVFFVPVVGSALSFIAVMFTTWITLPTENKGASESP
ncbi:hypothetical protein DM02DRAFT_658265 [Periconia macrospinosa]|uniref:MFS general substrate transporter n=1 Tax=Periconia macrospinosa TaxID=97972 RepID=A0A2V1DGX4_9PLEO|nr:hypothetical protein DM02DRAFT_658265 [Periconia macrospinosa]